MPRCSRARSVTKLQQLLQKKAFLEAAFQSMTVDETKRMQELAQILLNENESLNSAEEKVGALDELQELVETIDNAKNLFIVGGFGPLLSCLAPSNQSTVQQRSAEVLSTVIQNNPKAQLWAQQAGTLQLLTTLLPSSTSTGPRNYKLWAAATTALSSLVRDSKAGQRDLIVRHAYLPSLLHLATLAAQDGLAAATGGSEAQAARRCLRKSLFFFRHLIYGAEAERVVSFLASNCAQVVGGGQEEGPLTALARTCLQAGRAVEAVEDVDMVDSQENLLVLLRALCEPAVPFDGVSADADEHGRGPRGLSGPRAQQQQQTQAQAAQASADAATAAPLLLLGPSQQQSLESCQQQASSTTAAPGGEARPQFQLLDDRQRRACLRSAGLEQLLDAYASACESACREACSSEDSRTLLQEQGERARGVYRAILQDGQRQGGRR